MPVMWIASRAGRMNRIALVLGDLLMLMLRTRPDTTTSSSTIALLAITASTVRLGLSIPSAAMHTAARAPTMAA